jgi:hypothetical protein
MRTWTGDPIAPLAGETVIGVSARQLPGGDLVPQGTSSTQRDEIVPVFETLGRPATGRISRHGRSAAIAARTISSARSSRRRSLLEEARRVMHDRADVRRSQE